MKHKLYLKVISLMLTLTLLVGMVTPTVASAENIENNRNVNVSAISDALLNVLNVNNEGHVKQLEITDVEFELERDFDQTAYVTVKNTGAKDVEFILDITNNYDDIFLGFVGAGSPDQPTLVTAGSSVKVKLTVFAQKVGKNKYTLPVKSYIVDGANYILDTETELVINFKDANLNFACDLMSTNTDTLEQNFMLVNMGDDLNCVSVTADSDLAEYVTLNPTVSDTPVKNGESLNVTVTPNYTALKENNVTLVKGNLVISAVGKQQSFAVTIDTEGKEIHSITMGELVAYQKGEKEYYNVTADIASVADNVEITDNSVDGNIDYKMNLSIPFIDKNTNKEIANIESSYTATTYKGRSIKSGEIIEEKCYQDGDSIVYESKTYIGIDELKEFVGTIDPGYFEIINEDITNAEQNIHDGFFTFINDPHVTTFGIVFSETYKVVRTTSEIFSFLNVAKGAYEWVDGTNHEYEQEIYDSPNLTYAEKAEYTSLCMQQDLKGLAIPVLSFLATALLTGGVGIAVGFGLMMADLLYQAYLESKKNAYEAKAGIGDGVGGDGGQITTDNKRNQCTNAGKIEGDFNNPFKFPSSTGGGTGGSTGGGTGNVETPTTPTNPTPPTPPSNGNPSLGQDNRFVLLMDKNTVNPRELIKVSLRTNGTVGESDDLEYKLQYKEENYPLWSDYSEYTDYPVWHIDFKRASTYDVRCLIRLKSSRLVSYTATNEVYVTNTCLNGYFNVNSPTIFVTSRLAAGDEAANDDNMTTNYLVNGVDAGTITNNGHAQLSMAVVNATSENIKNGTNTITAKYSTTPTHYRTVSDMQIVTYYPTDTVVNYIGDIEYYPDVVIRPDFTIFEENIYTDSEFYVNEETILHCNVYNRNASGGWVDIIVKDGKEVIYTEENTWLGMFSGKILDIPWTPKTRESAITVELINKCTSTREADLTNNKAERNMKATEYIEPSFGETGNSIALEDREFSVYTHTLGNQNVTSVACYIDDNELKLSSANDYSRGIKYWTTIKGLSAGNHKLRYVITYDKAGNTTGTTEKIVDINVISTKSSSTVIAKNTSTNNTSAVVYRGAGIYSTYEPDSEGNITIIYNTDMYSNRDFYKLAVYTEKGVYVTNLTAGTISVDNTKLQNTFKVAIGLSSWKYANLYIKNNSSSYYQQLQYNTLRYRSETLFYLKDEDYVLYDNCDNAYMVFVTNSNTVYKLQIINNSKRVETFDKAIKLDENNWYNPIASGSNVTSKSKPISNPVGISGEKYNLISNWAYAYSNEATMNVQKLGAVLLDENITAISTSNLSADTYDVYYTLKSDNCIFDIYKEISIENSNVTNKISNSFAGEITATTDEVKAGENVNLSVSKLLDENGNQLTGISSFKGEFTVKITFTDVNDSNNVYTREINTKNLQDALTNVKAPEKFGKYKIALNVNINTYADIIIGDINSDGKLGLIDTIRMMRFLIGIDNVNDSQTKAADMDMSNTVTLVDVLMLQRTILGIKQ